MTKVKLNLSTGVVEKPILSCFKKDNNSYLILDAENVGNMGMPIIYVCKIVNDKVVKITDDTEWQNVKGDLKAIISNQPMEYFMPMEQMPADDIYFTQLTLSNDNLTAIKNNFNVPATDPQANPVENVISAPVVSQPVETTSVDTPASNEPTPLDLGIQNPVVEETKIEPVVAPEPVTPIIEPAPDSVEPQSVIEPVAPQVEEPTPVATDISNNTDIATIKDKFLKGCEMMFDALVELNK